MARNNAVIMAVLLLIIGVKLIGDAISGFARLSACPPRPGSSLRRRSGAPSGGVASWRLAQPDRQGVARLWAPCSATWPWTSASASSCGRCVIIFFMIIFFVILFQVVFDLFRDHELSGWAKAGWLIFIIVLPFLGLFVYLIVRGKGMAERSAKEQVEAKQEFDAVRPRDRRGAAGPRPRSPTRRSSSTTARSPRRSSTPSSQGARLRPARREAALAVSRPPSATRRACRGA